MLLNQMQIVSNHNIYQTLQRDKYCLVRADDFHLTPNLYNAWKQLQAAYADLPPDDYLPSGGSYRFRRYDRFAFDPHTGQLERLPHQDYFQDTDINQVTGGIVRKFAPLTDDIASNAFLHELIRFDFMQFPLNDKRRNGPWNVDVHLVRVIAREGEIGQPTPEGIHRDGAAFVTVHLAELSSVTGGVVSVYDDNREQLAQFKLENVLDAYLFRDEVLWHGVTPIRATGPEHGIRSILTFDYHPVSAEDL